MAYEPTNWKKGDVITSAKLNKLEQGVAGAGGVLVAHMIEETSEQGDARLDKTWQEIYDASFTIIVYVDNVEGQRSIEYYFVFSTFADEREGKDKYYEVYAAVFSGSNVEDPYLYTFVSSSPDEYLIRVSG